MLSEGFAPASLNACKNICGSGFLTPASSGVAPKGLGNTGSPEFSTVWTYLGLPSISLPLLTGKNDLPLGIQLIGDKHDDLRFLGVASWVEKNCKQND